MANYTFKDYVDGVVSLLANLKVENGGLAKTLKAYGGEITINVNGLFYYASRPLPMVLVEVDGAEYAPGGHPYHTQTTRLNIYVVTDSERSDEQAFERSSELLDDIRTLLLGQSLLATEMRLLLESEQKMDATPDFCFYLATYTFVNPRIAEA